MPTRQIIEIAEELYDFETPEDIFIRDFFRRKTRRNDLWMSKSGSLYHMHWQEATNLWRLDFQ